ncbi:MAG: LysR family transcriptional regulator [Pseudomonadales bacterium]
MSTLLAYRVLVAIVDQNSLSGIAKELHMSPSSVSKQLSKLETYCWIRVSLSQIILCAPHSTIVI